MSFAPVGLVTVVALLRARATVQEEAGHVPAIIGGDLAARSPPARQSASLQRRPPPHGPVQRQPPDTAGTTPIRAGPRASGTCVRNAQSLRHAPKARRDVSNINVVCMNIGARDLLGRGRNCRPQLSSPRVARRAGAYRGFLADLAGKGS
jgi:hypothetical protein